MPPRLDDARPGAVRMLLEALSRDPADHTIRLALADALEEAGRLGEAEVARLHARQLMRVGTKEELDRLCALLARGVRPVVPELVNSIGMRLVLVPPGRFWMGSPEGEEDRVDNEQQHEVELTRPFGLGVFLVTQAEYAALMAAVPGVEARPSWFQKGQGGAEEVEGMDTGDFPVEKVCWDEATELCRRLTEKERSEGNIGTEQEYDLPTEAEWEYACRGGAVTPTPFQFGDRLSSTQANINGYFPFGGAAEGPYLERTCKVGSYPPNAFGLYDLCGNVWEWCRDGYDEGAYECGARRDPLVLPKEQGADRVIRGGGWASGARSCRSGLRGRSDPSYGRRTIGLRVALVPFGRNRR